MSKTTNEQQFQAEYNEELPDGERKRRLPPWDHDSWEDVDLDEVECRTHPGSTEGSLHCQDCEVLTVLLGQPVDYRPGHPGDFCEVHKCLQCEKTGRLYLEHYPVHSEQSEKPAFDYRYKYTGILRE